MIATERHAAAARDELEIIAELLDQTADEVEVAALNARAEELKAEVGRYENLVSGRVAAFSFDSLAQVPRILTEARLAHGLKQKELADKLGVTEQMVQKDEAGGYGKASLARLLTVARALGLEFVGCSRIRSSKMDLRSVVSLDNDPRPPRRADPPPEGTFSAWDPRDQNDDPSVRVWRVVQSLVSQVSAVGTDPLKGLAGVAEDNIAELQALILEASQNHVERDP